MEDERLEKRYRLAIYRLVDPPIRIELGKGTSKFRQFLQSRQIETWAFITAHNPHSTTLDDLENTMRNARLKKQLQRFYVIHEGVGESEDSTWRESSFLIENIVLPKALSVATSYGQKAILFGSGNGRAELHFTDR